MIINVLSVDVSSFIVDIFSQLAEVIFTVVDIQNDIIVFNSSQWGLQGDFSVSLLDFNIGLVVIGLVVGAFLKINRSDDFYSNRKD